MLPALRFEGLRALLRKQEDAGLGGAARGHAADAGERDTGDAAREARGGRRGEEQFVVFAAVQGLVERSSGSDGQGGGLDFGGEAGLFAEVHEVGGEAVANIDGGGGGAAALEPEALEPEALRNARLRIEVRGEGGSTLGGRGEASTAG